MTDRDRLAADLRDADARHSDELDAGIIRPWEVVLADRLIALGWTRLDEEERQVAKRATLETIRRYRAGDITERQACDWFGVDRLTLRTALGFDEPLDEERLARALMKTGNVGPGYFPGTADVTFIVAADRDPSADFAAAIAKAYREDTE